MLRIVLKRTIAQTFRISVWNQLSKLSHNFDKIRKSIYLSLKLFTYSPKLLVRLFLAGGILSPDLRCLLEGDVGSKLPCNCACLLTYGTIVYVSLCERVLKATAAFSLLYKPMFAEQLSTHPMFIGPNGLNNWTRSLVFQSFGNLM